MTEIVDANGVREVLNLPFPAATKQAAGMVNGILTDVMSVSFSDKILVTISQRGRLAHWVCKTFHAGNFATYQLIHVSKVTCANGERQPRH